MKKKFLIIISIIILNSNLYSCGICSSNSQEENYAKLDLNKECNVKKNGIPISFFKTMRFNKLVKFKKLNTIYENGLNNDNLIIAIENAMEKGSKYIEKKDLEIKKIDFNLEVAELIEKSCVFSIKVLSKHQRKKHN